MNTTNALMRRVGFIKDQREGLMVQMSYPVKAEDYLGVTLIQSVDYVII